jgi:hypothetical protein
MNALIPNLGAYLAADDRNEVARRALVQVLAIRAWQLRHDGRLPDRLEALVPEELPNLPGDPYHFTGRPFGYSPRSQDLQGHPDQRSSFERNPGTGVLYSVGPNGRNNHAMTDSLGNAPGDDFIFPIPPAEGAGAGGRQGQSQAGEKERDKD